MKEMLAKKRIYLVMIAEEFKHNVLPFPILYVGTALKKAGYGVELRHINPAQIEETTAEICSSDPLMVGFSVLTGVPTYRSVIMSKLINKNCPAPIVWGGVHPSLLTEQCIKEDFIDFVISGEGEESALGLADALCGKRDFNSVNGLVFKDKNGVAVINSPRNGFINLENYPIDYSLINVNDYIFHEVINLNGKKIKVRSIGYCASRGCPHSCGFCYNIRFNQRRWRGPGENFVINDIQRLKNDYGITKVHFWDDNFFANPSRAVNILKAIDMPSGVDLRIDYINDERGRQLKELKVVFLLIGIESGSDRLLKLMKKGFSRKEAIESSKILAKYRINTLYSAIFGLPTETDKEFKETIDMLLEIRQRHKEASFTVGMYLPYPCTDLFELSVRSGFKTPETTEGWQVLDRWKNIVPLPWIDKKVCLNVRHLFYFLTAGSWIERKWAYLRLKAKVLSFKQDIRACIVFKATLNSIKRRLSDILKRKNGAKVKLSLKGRTYRYVLMIIINHLNSIWRRFRKNKKIIFTSIKKVLIINTNMAGDNIVSTPMIRNVAKYLNYPAIYLLSNNYSIGVLNGNPHIKHFIVIDKFYNINKGGSFLTWLNLIMLLRKEKFDLVIDTEESITRVKRTLLPLLTMARYRIGFRRGKGYSGIFNTHESAYKLKQHGSERLLDLIKSAGFEVEDDYFEVYYSNRDLEDALKMISVETSENKYCIIGLHAGNINQAKLWDLDKFASTADILAEKYNAKIILTGSSQDFSYLQALEKKMKKKAINLAGKTSFLQLSALIANLSLLITLDTVTVHIAAATNTPTIGIYGQSYISGWFPWNKERQVLITSYHKCGRCTFGNYLDKVIPNYADSLICDNDYSCARKITIEEVLAAADILLRRYPPNHLKIKPRE